ncbi:MAG TPA: chemotaxis protein CheB [Candidatus Binatia bacterium]|jgi:two-component system CheB/CheR fusion protein
MSSSDNRDDSEGGEQPSIPDEEHNRAAQPVDGEESPRLPFPVVGIGASAGGLEAAIELFSGIPADSGMAFVLVQHLPPDRKTLVAEILQKKTALTVLQVQAESKVEPNTLYVIQPGRTLRIENGRFHLTEPLDKPMHSRPIDDFFRSLAEEQRERGIAIILSGMGSNGAAGCQAIKAVGGLCIAQDPETAAFPSMPHHLIDAGYADYILKLQDIPAVLLSYANHPYAKERRPAVTERHQQQLREILAVLRTRTRHDFGGYKKGTVMRRVQRRMGLARLTKLGDYARMLRQTPTEVAALADDLLIHVTGFFRDPYAWEALRERVIVPLVAARENDSSIRAWVAACASGEEAYTLAILLVEEAERAGKRLDIRILATDTAERSLQNARLGVYPGGIESELTPERLERFFQREDAVYRVRQELRERVVFAPQNVLQDPPFSRLDIVTCRNLLIYLEPDLQQRLLALLHFGLRDGGALFLGTSETPGPSDELFEQVDKKARIFRRVGPTRHGSVEFPLPRRMTTTPTEPRTAEVKAAAVLRPTIAQLTTRVLLEYHTPPAVTIDHDYCILYYHGDASPYLAQRSGEPTRDLMAVLREPLYPAVRSAFHRAAHTRATATEDAWIDRSDGVREHVLVAVSPVSRQPKADLFVVSFKDLGQSLPEQSPVRSTDREKSTGLLRRMRDELQGTVEELQTSNEELRAAHEEVISTNEELQSANEEMELSREEMQSLNEELSTVNSQLQAKIDEYQAVTNDLTSLLTSTDLAVLFLDTSFRIRRFTPQLKELIELISTDVGRPLSDLALKFDDPDLLADAATVLERLVPCEREIAVDGGRWFLRRITSYRTGENRIEGVVVAFIETTARKRAEEALRDREEQFRHAIEHAPIPVILQNDRGEVVQLSTAWTELTGYGIRDIPVREAWLSLLPVEEAARLAEKLDALFSGQQRSIEMEFPIRTRDDAMRYWRFSASLPHSSRDGRRICVGMAVDISDLKRAEADLRASRDTEAAASAMKDQFLASISHELRTPLSVVLMWAKLLSRDEVPQAQRAEAIEAIVRSAEAQRRLIEDLLDTTRMASGKLRVALKPIELAAVVQAAVDLVAPLADRKGVELKVQVPATVPAVMGDSGRLEQVVWILLSNAIKFTPRGGRVQLKLRKESESLVLVVSDTGEGIAPSFLPDVFAPFAQAGRGDRVTIGLGLGLSIAQSLVQLHGGSISAASDGQGRGATFTVRLPIATTATVEPDAGSPGRESLEGVSVLVVEDNPDTLKVVQTALQSAGATVHACSSAAEALSAYSDLQPGILLSDISMPDMDGLELMRRIRGMEAAWHRKPVPSVALTAMAAASDRDAARDCGFDEFLAKPIDPESLVATLRAVLDGGR